MIKHTLKDKQVHISIENKDFSYRIPVKKIGNTVNWRIGEKDTDGIVIKDVSTWALQLFTKTVTEEKYVTQFMNIVKEHAPNSNINWDDTLIAVNIQNEYNELAAPHISAAMKMSEEDIIATLEKKYNLDF